MMVRLVFGTMFGAALGWFFLGRVVEWPFLGRFQFHAWLPKDTLTQAVWGAIAGLALAVKGEIRIYRRYKATRQLAEELSLNYSATGAAFLAERMKTVLDQDGSVSLENVCFGKSGDVEFWIGDLSHRSKGDDGPTVQTVAYVEYSKFNLPQFSLQVEGMFMNLLSMLIGVEDIDFDSHPVFSNSYHLSGKPADEVRLLFQSPLLDFFSRRSGWEVRGEENRLVVMRPGQRVATGELLEFVRDALEIVTFFRRAAQTASEPAEIAAYKLRLAMRLIASLKKKPRHTGSIHAKKRLQEIIDDYPKTDSAKEAAKLLKKL